MKASKTKLLLVSCALLPAFAMAAESEFDPLNTAGYASHKLTSSVFLTAASVGDQVIMAGERGIVIRSTGNGEWSQDSVPVSTGITKVKPLTEGALALGHSGTILYIPNDTASEWQTVITGVDIPDIYQRYIDSADLSDDDRQMLEREVEGYIQQGPDKPFFDAIELARGRIQVFGAYGLALELTKTESGFDIEPITHRFEDNGYMHLYGAVRHEGTIYIVGEQGTLYRSDDEGSHYRIQESPYRGSFFGATEALGELFIYGMKGNLYRRNGDGWSAIPVPTEAAITDIGTSGNELYVLSQSGEVFTGCTDECRLLTQVNAPAAAMALKGGQIQLSTFAGPQVLQ